MGSRLDGQFIATGVVSFPRSYYREVTAQEFGCIHSFHLNGHAAPRRSVARYASCEPDGLSGATEDEIAERLAQAIIEASAAVRCRCSAGPPSP